MLVWLEYHLVWWMQSHVFLVEGSSNTQEGPSFLLQVSSYWVKGFKWLPLCEGSHFGYFWLFCTGTSPFPFKSCLWVHTSMKADLLISPWHHIICPKGSCIRSHGGQLYNLHEFLLRTCHMWVLNLLSNTFIMWTLVNSSSITCQIIRGVYLISIPNVRLKSFHCKTFSTIRGSLWHVRYPVVPEGP